MVVEVREVSVSEERCYEPDESAVAFIFPLCRQTVTPGIAEMRLPDSAWN